MNGERIIRADELTQKTGMSRRKVYLMMADGRFPKQVPLGPNSVGWLESEVDDWIRQQVAKRDEAHA